MNPCGKKVNSFPFRHNLDTLIPLLISFPKTENIQKLDKAVEKKKWENLKKTSIFWSHSSNQQNTQEKN